MPTRSNKSNRDTVRAPVIASQIEGVLTKLGTKESLAFEVWDISPRGFGIVTADHPRLIDGEKVKMNFERPMQLEFECIVCWGALDASGENSTFRYGLEVQNHLDLLQPLFEYFRAEMEDSVDKQF